MIFQTLNWLFDIVDLEIVVYIIFQYDGKLVLHRHFVAPALSRFCGYGTCMADTMATRKALVSCKCILILICMITDTL